jgi:hypothetical protein
MPKKTESAFQATVLTKLDFMKEEIAQLTNSVKEIKKCQDEQKDKILEKFEVVNKRIDVAEGIAKGVKFTAGIVGAFLGSIAGFFAGKFN